MKIGSKLAIKSLTKKENKETKEVYYQATLCELNQNPSKLSANKWEINFYLANLPATQDIEEAKYTVELPDKVVTYIDKKDKQEKSFTVQPHKYDFARIANPEKSIIRVLDFEYKHLQKIENGSVATDFNGQPIYVHKVNILEYEPDKVGWKLPESKNKLLAKSLEAKLNTALKKIKKLQSQINLLTSSNPDIKTMIMNGKFQFEELPSEVPLFDNLIAFKLNDVEFPLEHKEEFAQDLSFVLDDKEYNKLKKLDGLIKNVYLYVNNEPEARDLKSISFDVGEKITIFIKHTEAK